MVSEVSWAICARPTIRSASSPSARSPRKISSAVSTSARRRTAWCSKSTVHTVGGVITAGDAIMMIVPQADALSVEAKVNPQDIDKLQG